MLAQPLITELSYSPTTLFTSACAASQELMFIALILLIWSCSSVSSLSMSGEIDLQCQLEGVADGVGADVLQQGDELLLVDEGERAAVDVDAAAAGAQAGQLDAVASG